MRQAEAEWLETDGAGGYASGAASGVRTRRYHSLLTHATTPPTGRLILVNGFDAWVETSKGEFALSSQHYATDIIHPDGADRIVSFSHRPWPTWTFQLEDGSQVTQEIAVCQKRRETIIRWRFLGETPPKKFRVRPFLSCRGLHDLHLENASLNFDAEVSEPAVTWRPYEELPAILALSDGEYRHKPLWYRNFGYVEEQDRGFEFKEDLASPGIFVWTRLDCGEAVLILRVRDGEEDRIVGKGYPRVYARRALEREAIRRQNFPTPLHLAADAYLADRGKGKTIMAGYPWFTDWGRDTFIALRGLCLATERLDAARDILLTWAAAVSKGMLPNRFPEEKAPEYNSVDASLWFVVACHDFLQAAHAASMPGIDKIEQTLSGAILAIVEGYRSGTRYGIRADSDGLLAAGQPGLQLTWMDAMVDGVAVTPRTGKPVEVQALWLNAIRIASEFDSSWSPEYERGLASFRERFWREDAGCLYDVVDVDHQAGKVDTSFRPNQIFAVGGLPYPLLEGEEAIRLVDAVEARLLTPMGLRTLAPEEAGYCPRYEGGPGTRDAAYHQGTVWPWLMGPFVEAWLRVRDFSPDARVEARERFLAPLLAHLDTVGLGHVSEIADAEPPHRARGCPFQAWSLGELMRLDALLDGRMPCAALHELEVH